MKAGFFLRCALLPPGLVALAALAQPAAYTCKDANGRTIIQQTPCKEVNPPPPPPPPPKPPCSLDTEQLRRASRAESQFLMRSPDEASHRTAQRADLRQVADRIRVAKGRFDELAAQRERIDKELEFYKNKPVPAWLKAQLDANEAQFAALADILRGHSQEIAEIQARYECQRKTFGKLWSGAAPGSSACDRPACAPP